MSADNEFGASESAHGDAPHTIEERTRWWIRNPTAGVLVATLSGLATCWVTLSIKTPDSSPGSTLLYMVILPIALLLPAIAIGGALVTWHAFHASRGMLRRMLAAPAALALTLNLVAVALFARWVLQIFSG
ncbi:MAG: hypothetical protein GTO41_09465 [Burkholderiales bacterium]|nr:hypothetical protein [Burkholderiales bacterium]